MASSIWRRLVIRPLIPYVNAYRRSKASAVRRLLRACRRSAIRWRPSARLRAWTDFVLTLQKYHASRSRKGGTWKLLSPDRPVWRKRNSSLPTWKSAIQQTRRSALRSHGKGVGPPATALLWSSRLEDQTCRFFVRGLRHKWIGLKCHFGISRTGSAFRGGLALLSVMAGA